MELFEGCDLGSAIVTGSWISISDLSGSSIAASGPAG